MLAAYAMALVRQLGVGEAIQEQLARAREAVDRASAVAPDLVEAEVASAMVTLHEGDPVAAAQLAARAVGRGPRSADAHDLAARMLYEAGALDRADAHAEHARHHEPRLASTPPGSSTALPSPACATHPRSPRPAPRSADGRRR